MNVGKAIRMERLMNRETRNFLLVPMDHGVSVGPLDGLIDMRKAVEDVACGGANAVIGHKGLARCGHRKGGRDIGLLLHLSSSTDLSPAPNYKVLTASVEDAIRLGADGVSMHVNLGDPCEASMLKDLGKVARDAEHWGMPLLLMIYGRGPKIANSFAPEIVKHCARIGAELGADLVKVSYTGDMDSFAEVVESTCIPVLIAGGPKTETDKEFLQMVQDSMRAGASGLSVGRNIFQHANPRAMVSALSGIVHENWSVEQALDILLKGGACA